jgi:hypothetical protein
VGLLRSVDVALLLVDAIHAGEGVFACFAFIGLDLVSYNVCMVHVYGCGNTYMYDTETQSYCTCTCTMHVIIPCTHDNFVNLLSLSSAECIKITSFKHLRLATSATVLFFQPHLYPPHLVLPHATT